MYKVKDERAKAKGKSQGSRGRSPRPKDQREGLRAKRELLTEASVQGGDGIGGCEE